MAKEKMNVIWIIADTFRRDALGAYGNKKIHTPSLDSLATISARFNRHYAASFPTMPARADFFTGRYSLSFMQWEPLPHDHVTLPQLLLEKDIHTAAVVDTPFFIRNGMNYDKGFQTFHEIELQSTMVYRQEEMRSQWIDESDRFAPRTFTKAMKWLERHYKDHFFLYIDTWDPHEAWDAPNYYTELYWPDYDGEIIDPIYGYWQGGPDLPDYSEDKVKKAYATYCGEVTMVDTWIGYFLRQVENMNLMDKTAIIFTSDHGFYFGEHGGLFGKACRVKESEEQLSHHELGEVWVHSPIYEEVSIIPLLIYLPNQKPVIYDGLTSAIDLMPTILDIVELEIPSFVEGKSLLPATKDPTVPGWEYVITSHFLGNPGDTVRMVDDNTRKLTMATTPTITTSEWTLLCAVEPGLSELYHLKTDPHQEKNLITQHPDKAHELHQLFVKFMKETNVSSDRINPRLELRI
jgi:arylsulfatase A-like enzyme